MSENRIDLQVLKDPYIYRKRNKFWNYNNIFFRNSGKAARTSYNT